jgi:hypothetical protein
MIELQPHATCVSFWEGNVQNTLLELEHQGRNQVPVQFNKLPGAPDAS